VCGFIGQIHCCAGAKYSLSWLGLCIPPTQPYALVCCGTLNPQHFTKFDCEFNLNGHWRFVSLIPDRVCAIAGKYDKDAFSRRRSGHDKETSSSDNYFPERP
jgi:hypothetical protein